MNKSKIIILDEDLSDDITIEYRVKKSNKFNMVYQNVSFSLQGLDARIEGLHNIIKYYDVIIDSKSFKRIGSNLYDDSVVKFALQLSQNDVDKALDYLRSGNLDPKKEFIYMRLSMIIELFIEE